MRLVNYANIGGTNAARKKFHRVSEMGGITSIIGRRYKGYHPSGSGVGKIAITHEVVEINGWHKSFRFGGILWGYSGEGPRSLCDLLQFCGFNKTHAEQISQFRRLDVIGTDWSIDYLSKPGHVAVVHSSGASHWKLTDVMVKTLPYQLIG